MKATIYHNPRCSKSRATLALLEDIGADIEIIEYLKTPPTADEIRTILTRLGLAAADVVRTGEAPFKDSGLALDSDEDDLIELIAREPIVLQRPIVVVGTKARIGRPPEQVLELFG
ncbi:MAG: arsenate reductase (glutaredoxin) [Gammaproteobacteria bacterium]|jgi:arsenate reductase